MPENEPAAVHGEEDGHGQHIHLPPNSIVPICMALSIALTFTGLLIPVKPVVGGLIVPVLFVVGLAAVVASGIAWLRSARREYLDLPE
jgi:hypothetical protein